jgi:hypothetical protein
MKSANRKPVSNIIYRQLADVGMSEVDRQRAAYALGDAESIVDAVIRVKEGFASLGALLLKPVFKH